MTRANVGNRIPKDWDFRTENTRFMTHGIHIYPARMIPQIAENLIRSYSSKNTVVLDPFCGSGGVLMEAVRANINSIGLDINPLACLISKIKSTPINPVTLSHRWSILRRLIEDEFAETRLRQYRSESAEFDIPNIRYWFKDYMIKELSVIKNSIDATVDGLLRDFFYVCFSSTVRVLSGTRKGEFKLYRMEQDKWENHNPDVLYTFSRNVQQAISMMGEFYNYAKENHIRAKSVVFQADTRSLFEEKFPMAASNKLHEGSVDLIVTSPPYGDSHTTVAYGQFSRYSLVLLGYPYEKAAQIDNMSLGGRRSSLSAKSKTLDDTLTKIHSDKRKREVIDFFVDLAKCLNKLSRLLSNSGHACFVLGNRTVSDTRIHTDEILKEFAKDFGLSWCKTIQRNIPNKRMPRRNSPTNIAGRTVETITKENIVVLKK